MYDGYWWIYIYSCSRWGYKPAYNLEAPSCTHVSFPVVMFAFLYPQTLDFPKMGLHTPQNHPHLKKPNL